MKAKKSLGQHFLASKGALDKIIDAADITPDDIVLEIGPGRGTLTEELLKWAGKVVAVEKDEQLILYLREKFKEEIKVGKFVLMHGDILTLGIENLKLKTENYKLIANIPYYITGAILEKFLAAAHQPARMVLLVQKEVAERIAREKKGSLLSTSVKAYGVPRYGATVKRGSFVPPPKVDSAILIIENISKNNFADKKEEEKFFSILKAGFAHKRKLLSGNLAALYGKERVAETFKSCDIDGKARAEELSVDTWKCLARILP
ncbi:MAG: 16S rRNA (adenine(1518)-N(6)/adenine(1519)-N(6))-dimethyltransferase RsmA [bacterium]|nr:16S rRNA (adenine(1518)-N(6)/adenine(1519)-N(6))-dimethyltransferase RsmA [bacterium]